MSDCECDSRSIRWRPFLGGDEDRNVAASSGVSDGGRWRPFLGGDEDRNAEGGFSRDAQIGWRPFLGGDEDRNVYDPSHMPVDCEWRPFLGGDEDRNSDRRCILLRMARVASLPRRGRGSQHSLTLPAMPARVVASLPRRGRGSQLLYSQVGLIVASGGVPSSEGTRIATAFFLRGWSRDQRVASLPRRGRGSQHVGGVASVIDQLVASLPRRGRGSQLDSVRLAVLRAGVASLPRRGRGSQLHLRLHHGRIRREWRPFLGGDEDRNSNSMVAAAWSSCGVPSSEGTRIATALSSPATPA